MGQCRSPSVSPSRQAASSTGPAQEELSLFQLFLLEGNPFERHIEHKEEETEDVLASNGVSVVSRTFEKSQCRISPECDAVVAAAKDDAIFLLLAHSRTEGRSPNSCIKSLYCPKRNRETN